MGDKLGLFAPFNHCRRLDDRKCQSISAFFPSFGHAPVFPLFLSLCSLSLCRSFSHTLLPVSLSFSLCHSNYLLPVPRSLSFCHSLPLLPVDLSFPLRSLSVAPLSLSLCPLCSPPTLSTVFLSCLFLPLTSPLAPAPLQSMPPRSRHCLLIKERFINSMIRTWLLVGTVTRIKSPPASRYRALRSPPNCRSWSRARLLKRGTGLRHQKRI